MHNRARWSLVAAGSLLALGAAELPWPLGRLALGGIGAWMLGFGLGLAPALALFGAAGCVGSGAWLGLGPRGESVSYASFAQIGTGIATLALVLVWRRADSPRAGPRWAGGLGILLALCACIWSARRAGLPVDSLRWLCTGVAAPVAILAAASFVSSEGVLRGRNWIQGLALCAAILCFSFPARCAFAAAPAALGLALCAGDALASARLDARWLGGAAFALLAGLAFVGSAPEPRSALPEPIDAQDQWVRWQRRVAPAGELAWEAELDARAPVAGVRLALRSCGEGETVIVHPMQREALPAGARYTHAPVALAGLAEPAWSVRLELVDAHGVQIGERVIDALLLPRAPGFGPAWIGFALAALCLCSLRGPRTRVALAGSLLVAAQAAWLYARA